MARVEISFPGERIVDEFTALVAQPTTPATAPPPDIGLVEISQSKKTIGGVYVSDTPPANPIPGMLWLESDTGVLHAWWVDVDSAQWVEVVGGVGTANASTSYVTATGGTTARTLADWMTADYFETVRIVPATPSATAKNLYVFSGSPATGTYVGPVLRNQIEGHWYRPITGTGGPGTSAGAWSSLMQINYGVGGVDYDAVSSFALSVGLISMGDDTSVGDKTAFSSGANIRHTSPGKVYGGASAVTVDTGGSAPNVYGFEVDVGITGTGSVDRVIGYNAWNFSTKAANVASSAYCVGMSGAAGALPWNKGFTLYTAGGATPFPLAATADVFFADIPGTVANVMNFGALTVTGSILNFPGVVLTGNALLTLGTATGAAGSVRVQGQAGTDRSLVFRSGTLNRWVVSASASAESSGDAGSPFLLSSWTDAGAFKETVMTITRATGAVALVRALSIGGNFIIPDGITAPGTIAGVASIYVDAADGDLKIKFSDGVTKTIMVDT